MAKNNWTREETSVAFNIYCKIPFKSSSKTNPTVIKYANIYKKLVEHLKTNFNIISLSESKMKFKKLYSENGKSFIKLNFQIKA